MNTAGSLTRRTGAGPARGINSEELQALWSFAPILVRIRNAECTRHSAQCCGVSATSARTTPHTAQRTVLWCAHHVGTHDATHDAGGV